MSPEHLVLETRDASREDGGGDISAVVDFAVILPSKDTPFRLFVPECIGKHHARLQITSTGFDPVGGYWSAYGRAHLIVSPDLQGPAASEKLLSQIQAEIGGKTYGKDIYITIRRQESLEFVPKSVVLRLEQAGRTPSTDHLSEGQAMVTGLWRAGGVIADSIKVESDRSDLGVVIERVNALSIRLQIRYQGPSLKRPETRKIRVRVPGREQSPQVLSVLLIPS